MSMCEIQSDPCNLSMRNTSNARNTDEHVPRRSLRCSFSFSNSALEPVPTFTSTGCTTGFSEHITAVHRSTADATPYSTSSFHSRFSFCGGTNCGSLALNGKPSEVSSSHACLATTSSANITCERHLRFSCSLPTLTGELRPKGVFILAENLILTSLWCQFCRVSSGGASYTRVSARMNPLWAGTYPSALRILRLEE